jgi:hypothetical protein
MNSTHNMVMTGGAYPLTIKGASSILAEIIQGNLTTGTSRGLQIQAGTNSSDFGFAVENAGASTVYFEVFGDGGVTVGNPTGGDEGVGALNVQNLDINGVQQFQTGTFTGTLTGLTTTVQPTITYTVSGNMVTLRSTVIGGTSNSTAFTMTGLPSALQPTATQILPCALENNTTTISGACEVVANSGTITFWVNNSTAISPSAWASSGTKGLYATAFTYMLN